MRRTSRLLAVALVAPLFASLESCEDPRITERNHAIRSLVRDRATVEAAATKLGVMRWQDELGYREWLVDGVWVDEQEFIQDRRTAETPDP